MKVALLTENYSILDISKVPFTLTSYGLYTLRNTETDTYTETDNKYTELNGNLCCYLSWCSVKCSAYYSETH